MPVLSSIVETQYIASKGRNKEEGTIEVTWEIASQRIKEVREAAILLCGSFVNSVCDAGVKSMESGITLLE